MSADTDHVRVDVSEGVGRIVMDRPETHNAMDPGMATALESAVDGFAADDDVRCLALTGANGVYSTGADLSTFEGDERDAEQLDAIAASLHGTVRAMVDAPKPVVGGVNGVVAGGGLGLALAADVVVCSDEARFEYAYPRIGLSGDGGATWFLPRLLGLRRAQSFAMLGEPIGPEEAVERGLATEVVPDESFEAELEKRATTLAEGPTRAFAEIKRLFRESDGTTLDDHLREEKETITSLAGTDDYVAGLQKFLEE